MCTHVSWLQEVVVDQVRFERNQGDRIECEIVGSTKIMLSIEACVVGTVNQLAFDLKCGRLARPAVDCCLQKLSQIV